ncbi:MAG: class I SAM-dependent methyltransferase [Bacteroidetes bacterium]|nr:class I SAM-dependent methyltransferase [Bacteroidota bacterium]MBU1720200.1 class I SAM-dependent methyltransferase [Bacteroidota bacterium]
MDSFWDERYKGSEYIYGIEPNEWLRLNIENLPPGLALFPCEGEGRNAVHAALKGWKVQAFDQSIEGQKKAMLLASDNDVRIDYTVGDVLDFQYPVAKYDLIAVIYSHFVPELRVPFHQKLIDSLAVNGLLILETFSKKQLIFNSGGPQDESMLYTAELLKKDFDQLKILHLSEDVVPLYEGPRHSGEAAVVRLVATKVQT